MSHAFITGILCNLKTYGWGYTFAIMEPRKLRSENGTVFHNVAVRGDVALRIAPLLKKGAYLELRCDISYTTKNGRTFTNFTAITCKVLPKPEKKVDPRQRSFDFDDDYFVPSVNHTKSREERRYEGHSRSY